jgi:hypothetical protein
MPEPEKKNLVIKEISPSSLSLLSTDEPMFFTEKRGWMKLGSKIQFGPKLRWQHRYFVLSNGWLGFYKNEDANPKDCFGFILLANCRIFSKHQIIMESASKSQSLHKILIKGIDGRTIYHRHCPDTSHKASLKKFLFVMRSSVCRLRIKDDDEVKIF